MHGGSHLLVLLRLAAVKPHADMSVVWFAGMHWQPSRPEMFCVLVQVLRAKQKIKAFAFAPRPAKGSVATLCLALANNAIEVSTPA